MKLRYGKTLLTGRPGVGKTTLIQKIIARMGAVNKAGFYTAEIRAKGARLGFELCGLNGSRGILAHVDIVSRQRVGKYGIDLNGFEDFLKALGMMDRSVELIVIDEIGRMELFSSRFRSLVHDVLTSEKQVLASIPIKGDEFIREIKGRGDVRLFEVTDGNRDHLPDAILQA